jgi:hypothetical protein
MIWEIPNVVKERVSSKPGIPPNSNSNGRVILASDSSGARFGTCVSTCTCTLLISGTTSKVRWGRSARLPAIDKRIRPITNPLWRMASWISPLSIGMAHEEQTGGVDLPAPPSYYLASSVIRAFFYPLFSRLCRQHQYARYRLRVPSNL